MSWIEDALKEVESVDDPEVKAILEEYIRNADKIEEDEEPSLKQVRQVEEA